MTSDGRLVFIDVWAKDWYLCPKKQRPFYLWKAIFLGGGYERRGNKVVCVVDSFTVHKSYFHSHNAFAFHMLDKLGVDYADVDDYDIPDWIPED